MMRMMARNCLKNSLLTPTRAVGCGPEVCAAFADCPGALPAVETAFDEGAAVKSLRWASKVAAGVGVMTTRATLPRDGTKSS